MAKPSSDMRFRIADLPEQRSFALPDEFVRDALGGIPGQDQLEPRAKADELRVDVEVSAEDHSTVFARGTLRGRATVACSRCLAPVALSVDERFELTFLPHEEAPAADDDGDDDLELDDVDLAAHDGIEVDVGPVLRDHVILSVPYAPLCSDGCKGLCQHCGANLNDTTCACSSQAPTSRWAALEQLKNNTPKSSS
jgi:uncharacterized protein